MNAVSTCAKGPGTSEIPRQSVTQLTSSKDSQEFVDSAGRPVPDEDHGKGNNSKKRRFDRKDISLYEKLSTETWLSLELAIHMHVAFTLSADKQQIWVHVDANPDERYDSSDYVKQLAGMVAGSGFPVLVKPNAWCASHVADFAVKNKHSRARMRAA